MPGYRMYIQRFRPNVQNQHSNTSFYQTSLDHANFRCALHFRSCPYPDPANRLIGVADSRSASGW